MCVTLCLDLLKLLLHCGEVDESLPTCFKLLLLPLLLPCSSLPPGLSIPLGLQFLVFDYLGTCQTVLNLAALFLLSLLGAFLFLRDSVVVDRSDLCLRHGRDEPVVLVLFAVVSVAAPVRLVFPLFRH